MCVRSMRNRRAQQLSNGNRLFRARTVATVRIGGAAHTWMCKSCSLLTTIYGQPQGYYHCLYFARSCSAAAVATTSSKRSFKSGAASANINTDQAHLGPRLCLRLCLRGEFDCELRVVSAAATTIVWPPDYAAYV